LVNSHYVEIKRGLQDGDQVIYAGDEMLREGDPVVPTEWGPSGLVTLPPATGEAAAGTIYTCPMHPEVRMNKPGECPKCGMKLQPEKAKGGSPASPGGAMPAGTHAVGGPGMGGAR
jgi:hypothetical protein